MNFQYKNVTVGADPELFLKDKEKGGWVAACGLIGGTKDKPRKIDKKGHAVQEDNVMVEFNIPPAKSEKNFVKSINHVLDHLRRTLPKYDLVIEASAKFPAEQLQNPQCMIFGCDPDFDAWNYVINPPPDPRTSIRTCGGHIHIGYENPDENNQVALIRAMDLWVGVPSIVLDPDKVRKSRYGKAGAFRPKDYGAEYRVASNHWLRNNQLIAWAYQNTMKAVEFLNSGKEIGPELGKRIQTAINTGDVALAETISKEYGALQGA